MSGVFGYTREAVRVKVRKCEGNQPSELRKFSVDPQITSFEVLQSILAKAFDLKGDFTISYKVYDVNGYETYMPLLSDWDLDAAFLKAHNISLATNSEPCLYLRVDLKSFEECSDDWEIKQNVSLITQFRTATSQEAKPSPRLHGIFNQMGKTLNMVQRAFNFGEDGSTSIQPPRPPLSDAEFRKFLDPVGQIVHSKELRSVIYFGGIDPSLRKVVWKHLLNVYPEGMTGKERMDYIKKKAAEYITLKETWKSAIAEGPVVGELAYTTGMVRKDVLRTDRHHPFYAGSDDNQNIAALFNILTTYALNHPKVSYCQGMSDLASPLLVTMNDEAHAYICFCALMQRLSTNFMIDGIAMTQKFTHLAEGLMYYDPEFYNYLKIHQADDLLFCYRWLLLEMKREFAFEDSLRMLEVLWSSLPADPPEKELRLYDTIFQYTAICTPPISPLVKTPRENAYTKICALRRQSSSISLSNYNAKKALREVHRQNHSLDESISACKVNVSNIKHKHQSLDDTALTRNRNKSNNEISPRSPKNGEFPSKSPDLLATSPKSDTRSRSVSPLEQKSDSVLLNNKININEMSKKDNNTLSSSMTNLMKNSKKIGHFKDLKEKIVASKLFSSLDRLDNASFIKEEEDETKPKGKLVKNLNEFLNFGSPLRIGNENACCTEPKPKITVNVIKSSFDDTTDSSVSIDKTRHHSSTSTNDDTFDEISPDDSQEYFPLTTSVTRELKLELENLDRQVFGPKYIEKLSESPSPDEEHYTNKELNIDNGDLSVIKDELKYEEVIEEAQKKRRSDDIFVWENPLHEVTSPAKNVQKNSTPDEQVEIEFDAPTIVNEESKTVTPIKIVNQTSKDDLRADAVNKIEPATTDPAIPMPAVSSNPTTLNGGLSAPSMTNSCEEVTEAIKSSSGSTSSSLLPPPNEFGGGNPFLMFLCITLLVQHRDHIMSKAMDYNEMAMHFDKMVRKHNVIRVLNQARQMYARYIKQHSIAAQQKIDFRNEDC